MEEPKKHGKPTLQKARKDNELVMCQHPFQGHCRKPALEAPASFLQLANTVHVFCRFSAPCCYHFQNSKSKPCPKAWVVCGLLDAVFFVFQLPARG